MNESVDQGKAAPLVSKEMWELAFDMSNCHDVAELDELLRRQRILKERGEDGLFLVLLAVLFAEGDRQTAEGNFASMLKGNR